MPRTTNWHEGWRRLGWTLAFGVLCTAVLGAMVYPMLPLIDVLGAIGFVLTLSVAFRIGVLFPSRWWVAGPPVAFVAAVFALLMLPSPTGDSTLKNGFVPLFFFGGWLVLVGLAVVYAVTASTGVKEGKRRAAAAMPSSSTSEGQTETGGAGGSGDPTDDAAPV